MAARRRLRPPEPALAGGNQGRAGPLARPRRERARRARKNRPLPEAARDRPRRGRHRRTVAAFLLPEGCADLLAAAQAATAAFAYADAAMEKAVSPLLPRGPRRVRGRRRALRRRRRENAGPGPARRRGRACWGPGTRIPHVGWILNRAYSLACYLEWAGVTHNAIATDTLLVSPRDHTLALAGGWWFAARAGDRLSALPARSLRYVTADMQVAGTRAVIADHRLDLELVRALGRELLGDETGTTFTRDTPAPEPMLRFLRAPSSGDARTDYREWSERILPACFGRPRFVDLPVAAADLYGKE